MKFFSFSQERVPLLITLSIVILLGVGYYFVYIPGNESDLKSWKFRVLKNIGRNIQSKIQTGHKQLTTYLNNDQLIDSSGRLNETKNGFFEKINTENLPISRVSKLSLPLQAHDSLNVTSIPRRLFLADSVIRNQTRFQLSLTYDFDKFIKPLLPSQVFDHYLIVKNDTILYETIFSGQTSFKDTVFLNRNKAKAASIIDREYAGIMYKLFILPVDLNANTPILVIGLLTAEHYSQAKTRLPPRSILFLITLFTSILITFPIIKLYQLREEDLLTVNDAVSVTVVCMFLITLIFLCFVKYSSAFSDDKRFAKLRLAESVSVAFLKEIKENYIKLDSLNSWIEHKSAFSGDFYRIGKSENANSGDSSAYTRINKIVKGLELDRIFWMDKNGVEFRTWTSGVKGFFPGRFDQRDYFKSIVNHRYYSLDQIPNSKLYVDQIVSWISGEFLTVIAKPSSYIDSTKKDTARVAAILFKSQSLKKAKIPPGYAFAMIDYNGRVLYHSDTTKNLNENLFEEFSDERNLQTSIKTGSFQPFKTHYYGREYDVQIKQVGGGLPYYLVIMESLIFEEYRDVNVYSFTLSMQLILFALIIIQVLAIFFASARLSVYKGRSFETSWLGPKATNRRQYLYSAIFNVSQFFILCLFFTNETILCRLFMLLASISLMPVFLNFLFYYKYKIQDHLARLKLRAAATGLVFTFFANFTAYQVLGGSFSTLLIFEGIAVLLGVAVWFMHMSASQKLEQQTFFCYKKAYTAMLVSWMLVAMGFSVLLFFRVAYDYDQHLIARYTQLEFADANAGLQARSFKAKDEKMLTEPQKKSLIESFYMDNYWVDSIWISKSKPGSILDDSLSINLLKSLHLYSNENIPDRIHLDNPGAFDLAFFFNNLIRQDPSQKSASLTYYRVVQDSYLILRSAALHFQLPAFFEFRGFFSWLVFLMVLIGFCVMAYGLIKRIFSLNMSGVLTPEPFNLNAWLINKTAGSTFLIGFDNAPFEGAKLEILTLDIAQMPVDNSGGFDNPWDLKVAAVCKDKLKVIVVKHFEHNFKNVQTSSAKMLLLEKLLASDQKRRILIRSTIHPTVLLASVGSSTDANPSRQTLERWNMILRAFEIVIDPLAENFTLENAVVQQQQMQQTEVYDYFTRYYHKYFSIWQSLSEQEKFLLYDMAEDDLVNTYDKNTCTLLIKKGIIKVRDGKLKFFSKGFRSFILSGLNHNELTGIIAKINDNANWNRIRMPLILISLAILIFILSSQRETSTKLLTTLGALATAIPALINLLSSVSGNNNKKTAG